MPQSKDNFVESVFSFYLYMSFRYRIPVLASKCLSSLSHCEGSWFSLKSTSLPLCLIDDHTLWLLVLSLSLRWFPVCFDLQEIMLFFLTPANFEGKTNELVISQGTQIVMKSHWVYAVCASCILSCWGLMLGVQKWWLLERPLLAWIIISLTQHTMGFREARLWFSHYQLCSNHRTLV